MSWDCIIKKYSKFMYNLPWTKPTADLFVVQDQRSSTNLETALKRSILCLSLYRFTHFSTEILMNLVIALTKTPITRLEISHWDLFVAIEIQKTRLSTASIFRHTHTTLNVYISSYVGEYGIYVKKTSCNGTQIFIEYSQFCFPVFISLISNIEFSCLAMIRCIIHSKLNVSNTCYKL